MNFAYLAGFQAIQFVDRPFQQTIDTFECEMNLLRDSFQGYLHKYHIQEE